MEAPETSFSRPFFSFLVSLSGFIAELFHMLLQPCQEMWGVQGGRSLFDQPLVVPLWASSSTHHETPRVPFQGLFAFGVLSVHHQLKKIHSGLEAERESG